MDVVGIKELMAVRRIEIDEYLSRWEEGLGLPPKTFKRTTSPERAVMFLGEGILQNSEKINFRPEVFLEAGYSQETVDIAEKMNRRNPGWFWNNVIEGILMIPQ